MIHLSKECFRFYIGDESRVVIEDAHKRDNSIFSEVYSKAFKVLNDLLPLLEMDKKKNVQDEEQESPCPSNIFAFIGDRGAGKTSCMKSVAEMLRSNNSVSESESVLPNFKGKKFEVLESTDPSFFSDNKNILEIFIGRLFSRFRNYVEKSERGKESEKNQVYQLFERVKQSLVCMEKKCIEEDDCAEQLIGLSASVELQNNIQNLINKFLNYIGKDFLVIPIDDLDLHTIHAFNMAEQIRKYLTQKNTIILMALKIEQLEYAVERHYLRHYQLMLEKNFLDKMEVSDMAFKYMTKLIPLVQRFSLKKVEELINENVEIYDKNKKIFFKEKSLKDVVTSLIFKKTRYLFYHSKRGASLIIPRTLREIRHLVDFLYRMPDYNENENYNKRLFKMYFFDQWALHNCDAESCKVLRNIYNHQDVESFNKNVIQSLKTLLGVNPNRRYIGAGRWEEGNTNLSLLIDKENIAYNISIGDAFAFIRYCEKIETKMQPFFFGLKFIYSLRLYEYYNRLTEISSNDGQISKNSNQTLLGDNPLKKDNATDAFSDYNILVGRSFLSLDELSNKDELQKNSFDNRLISIGDLQSILKSYKNDNDIYKLKVVEFIALSISRKYYWVDDFQYRKQDMKYDEKYIDDDYVFFNPLNIFANITDAEQCYRRVSDDLWEIANSHGVDSLYNRIKQICKSERSESKNPFLSCCCLRNAEILDSLYVVVSQVNDLKYLDLYRNLLDLALNGSVDNDLMNKIIDEQPYEYICIEYEYISNFYKRTYDKNEKDSYFEITFPFAKEIETCLKNEKFSSAFRSLYSKVSKRNFDRTTHFIKALKNASMNESDVLSSPKNLYSFMQKLSLNKCIPLLESFIDDQPFLRFRSAERRDQFIRDLTNRLLSLPVID